MHYHKPLIISIPGNENQKGAACSSITELIDVYPTLSELCGLSQKQPKILQGESLTPFLQNPTLDNKSAIAYTISENGKAASIRTKYWRYTRWGDEVLEANEELYDHINDPEEEYNLAKSIAHKSKLEELRTKFERVKSKTLQDK